MESGQDTAFVDGHLCVRLARGRRVHRLGDSGGLLWLLGWPRFPPAREFEVAQLLELLKITLAVVAGFGGVVLLAVNYRRQRVTEAEHELGVERGEREQQQVFTERFGAAAEQLAHTSAAVRIAGVYALAGLADDWAEQRQVCVEVLCGYLRLGHEEVSDEENEVRATVLRVIRERLSRKARGMPGHGPWHGINFDFTGTHFADADFGELRFSGDVLFDGVRFTGMLTSFQDTAFDGLASFHGATFAAERTSFHGAEFSLGGAEFVGADFTSEAIDFGQFEMAGRSVDFYRCNFDGCTLDFSLVALRSGVLRWDDCTLSRCSVELSPLGSSWAQDRNFGRVSVEGSRLRACTFELHLDSLDRHTLWLVDSRLDNVKFKVSSFDSGLHGQLNVRNLTLHDTELPERHIRHRD